MKGKKNHLLMGMLFAVLFLLASCKKDEPTSPPDENNPNLPVPVKVYPSDSAYNLPAVIILTWNKTANASSYSLQISDNSSFPSWSMYRTTTDTSFSLDVNKEKRYFWRVSSKYGNDNSAWSGVWTFYTGARPPRLVAPGNHGFNITLEPWLLWDADSSTTSFSLQVSKDSTFTNFIFNQAGIVDKAQYIGNLQGATTYFWRVAAKNIYGSSEWSDVYRFKTLFTGSIYLQSIPTGAHIWIDGVNSGKVTPDTLTNLVPGDHKVKLVLNIYEDSLDVTVLAGQLTVVPIRTLPIAPVSLSYFGPLQIGPEDPAKMAPDGIILKTGEGRYLENQSKTGVDARGTGYGFRNMFSENGRNTHFLHGTGTNLYDTISSPIYGSSGWTIIITADSNYFYFYDNDHHYSKMIKVNSGTYNRPWIDVIWLYNNREDDPRF